MSKSDSDRPTIPAPAPARGESVPRRTREEDETVPRIEIHRRAVRMILEAPPPMHQRDPRRE